MTDQIVWENTLSTTKFYFKLDVADFSKLYKNAVKQKLLNTFGFRKF